MSEAAKKSSRPKPKNVAEYIEWQIHLCGKKQADIAREAGFAKPNVITMLKQGQLKLPLERVGKFAKAIEVDPVFLFKMCMAEYFPETWEEIQKMFNQPIITENEIEIIELLRQSNPTNPRIYTDEERIKLATVFGELRADNEVVTH